MNETEKRKVAGLRLKGKEEARRKRGERKGEEMGEGRIYK